MGMFPPHAHRACSLLMPMGMSSPPAFSSGPFLMPSPSSGLHRPALMHDACILGFSARPTAHLAHVPHA